MCPRGERGQGRYHPFLITPPPPPPPTTREVKFQACRPLVPGGLFPGRITLEETLQIFATLENL